MKLVINAVMGAQMAALAEGIKLAEASELDTEVLHDLLCNGALSSPLVQGKGKEGLVSSYSNLLLVLINFKIYKQISNPESAS